jgi:hypothetical protein
MFKAIKDNIIAVDADFGEQTTAGGIILAGNVDKSQGITSRWFRVLAVGPQIDWLSPGKWVLVDYGRWSSQFNLEVDGKTVKAWKIDPNGCACVADEKPSTVYYNSDVITAEKKVL